MRAKRSTLAVVAQRYKAIGWGPIKVGPLPMQTNQADVTSQKPANGPGDRAWQGVQKHQIEVGIYPGWASQGGIPYYDRRLVVDHLQFQSYYGQMVGPGTNVYGNGSVLEPPSQTGLVAALRQAVLNRYGRGS